MSKSVIAVIGGTGDLGGGLAYRWAKAGYPIVIGSRTEEKALAARDTLRMRLPEAQVEGAENAGAAERADIIAVSVPFSHQHSTLEVLKPVVQGKIVIDTTVCLQPPKVGRVQLPPEGSAGLIAQEVLGSDVRVVSAFQNIAAAHLDSDHEIDCDVLVTGDDKEAREVVIDLAADAGLKAWSAGPLANSAAVEGLTSILITLNRIYKIPGSGIVVTGKPGV